MKSILHPARLGRSLLCGVAALAFCSCANVSHMLLYHDRHLGIKGGVNPETNNVAINVGYRSNFASIIPKVEPDPVNAPKTYEAASVYSSSRIVIRGLGVPDVEELTATGDAAVAVGKSADGQQPFTSKN